MRQLANEVTKSSASYLMFGGNCHSTGPSFSLRLNSPTQKIRERFIYVSQSLHVGNEAATLDAEHEPLGVAAYQAA